MGISLMVVSWFINNCERMFIINLLNLECMVLCCVYMVLGCF